MVESDVQKARDLVVAVGGLPLALNLIGNYLRTQKSRFPQSLSATFQKLSDQKKRLSINDLPDEVPLSLRSAIAVTDEYLAPEPRQAFHALSTFPPRPQSFSEEAALAVTASTVEILDPLIDKGLLEITSAGRYSLHQTIADYARLQLHDTSAFQRLVIYMTAFVEQNRKVYALLEPEHDTILAALDIAIDQQYQSHLLRIALAFAPFLLAHGLYPTAERYLQCAYRAAALSRDHASLAGVLLHLGEMTWKRGDYEQAENYLQEGLRYAREIDDHERACAILANLGSISWKSGDYQQAENYVQEGLILARHLGSAEGLIRLLDILGSIEIRQGNYEQSEKYLQEGLTLARAIEDQESICSIIINLGLISGEQGNYMQAGQYWQEGLLLARQMNHSEWMSGFLNNLGDVASEQGNYEQATRYFQEGLHIARKIEHQEWISFLLFNLGLTTRKQKNYSLSERYLQESLQRAKQLGIAPILCYIFNEYGNLHLDQAQPVLAKKNFEEVLTFAPEGGNDFIALATYGLARVAASLGNTSQAKQLGEQSVLLLEHMGRREAQEVREWLFLQGKQDQR